MNAAIATAIVAAIGEIPAPVFVKNDEYPGQDYRWETVVSCGQYGTINLLFVGTKDAQYGAEEYSVNIAQKYVGADKVHDVIRAMREYGQECLYDWLYCILMKEPYIAPTVRRNFAQITRRVLKSRI